MPNLEQQFVASWADIVEFYEFFATASVSSGAEVARGMLPLVRTLAASPVVEQFRAGQSLTTLIISRAFQHGLHDSEPFIAVFFDPELEQFQLTFRPAGMDGKPQDHVVPVGAVSARLAELLQALKSAAKDPAA